MCSWRTLDRTIVPTIFDITATEWQVCYGGRGSHGDRKPCKVAIGFVAIQELVDQHSLGACCEAYETMPATALAFTTILTTDSLGWDAVALPKGWARYITDRRLKGAKSTILSTYPAGAVSDVSH